MSERRSSPWARSQPLRSAGRGVRPRSRCSSRRWRPRLERRYAAKPRRLRGYAARLHAPCRSYGGYELTRKKSPTFAEEGRSIDEGAYAVRGVRTLLRHDLAHVLRRREVEEAALELVDAGVGGRDRSELDPLARDDRRHARLRSRHGERARADLVL